jgi:hypothetical protein
MLLGACSVPQMRVFQQEVPKPTEKSQQQIEAERSAADLLARKVTEPAEMIPVAQKLSDSLGVPTHPIAYEDLNKARGDALDRLLKGMIKEQNDALELNRKLDKYDGKKIEGTGFNMFGVAVSGPILIIIALCIFFPGTITVIFWILRRVRGTLVSTVQGIQNFKEENPEVAKALNNALKGAQDEAHKVLVKKIKSTL